MQPRIDALAERIATRTTVFSEYLKLHSLPQPSFEESGPIELQIDQSEVLHARSEAINACYELIDLLQGPKALVTPVANATSIQAICRYEIYAKVPVGRDISFEDLAEKCEIHESDLRRIIRFAITYHRVFQEKRPGFVSHSAASRWLAENEMARNAVSLVHDTFYKSFAQTVNAMQKFRNQEPNETGFSLSHDTNESFFEYLASHPEEARRFGGAMKAFTANIPGNSPDFLIKTYPWHLMESATVVDVGGSHGHISLALAAEFPNMSFIVQDLPDVVRHARIPPDLAGRFRVMEHDFFEPQTASGDIYLFRWIFHDWPDKYVVKILQQLVPALKSGDRILVNDSICPGPNTVPYDVERTIRALDMVMLSLHNSREREIDEWKRLFQDADSRFGTLNIHYCKGASLSVIESVWQG